MVVSRGTAGTGAVIGLSAIGKQNLFLEESTFNEKTSLFNPKIIQHGNFTLFQSPHTIHTSGAATWPFGETLRFKINPKTSGDILSRAYVKLTMPKLQDSNTDYTINLGNAIIKEYSFKVGGRVIETIPMDWNIIHEELYADESERRANRYINNNGQDNVNINTIPGTDEIALYVPLYFFFNRTDNPSKGTFKPYFFTCACTAQDIEISVTFNKIPFFTNGEFEKPVDKVTLVLDEATLTEQERNYYMANKQMVVYNTIIKQPIEPLGKKPTKFKNFLVASKPVKAFHWFFRKKNYEDDTTSIYYKDRFNFSYKDRDASNTANSEDDANIMESANIYLNGHQQIGLKSGSVDHTYYKSVVPIVHKLDTPDRNIYSYSFSLNPKDPQPAGSLDFSTMNHSKTMIVGNIKEDVIFNQLSSESPLQLHLYYIGYLVMVYENDHCGLVFA
jgi:hypothetical protein